MNTTKLTVRLPKQLHRLLKRKAQRDDRSLNQEIVMALEKHVDENKETAYPTSEYERTLRVIRESGLWEPIGSAWDRYIDQATHTTVDEVRQMWRGQAPLSEDIITDRGERG